MMQHELDEAFKKLEDEFNSIEPTQQKMMLALYSAYIKGTQDTIDIFQQTMAARKEAMLTVLKKFEKETNQ